jgi:hypothetical protein
MVRGTTHDLIRQRASREERKHTVNDARKHRQQEQPQSTLRRDEQERGILGEQPNQIRGKAEPSHARCKKDDFRMLFVRVPRIAQDVEQRVEHRRPSGQRST